MEYIRYELQLFFRRNIMLTFFICYFLLYLYSAVSGSGSERVDYVKSIFLESNPLLEAFGNVIISIESYILSITNIDITSFLSSYRPISRPKPYETITHLGLVNIWRCSSISTEFLSEEELPTVCILVISN